MNRAARDGHPARVAGPWTQEKLTYVGKYSGAFMKAMAPKRKAGVWSDLVYIDLLSGPGLGIDRDTGIEFDGSPLRALNVQPPFDHLFFGDLSHTNIDALRRRIPQSELHRVTVYVGDCNTTASQVMQRISPRTLGLAFVDPEGFEATFALFQILSARRIDVLLLFPSGIGIRRNLANFAKQEHSPLDDLWGGREWRALPPAKLAAGKKISSEEALSLDRPWVMAFRGKMATLGFIYQDESDPCFVNEKHVPMYHLLFFSKDAAGLTIWRGIKKIEPSGQRILPI